MVKAATRSAITILGLPIARRSSPRPSAGGVFVVAGALYLAINFIATQAILYAERRLTPPSAADRAKAAERRQKAMLAR